MNADAIVFQSPCQLSVQPLPLRAMVPGDDNHRIHFILDANQATATNRFRFTIDTF